MISRVSAYHLQAREETETLVPEPIGAVWARHAHAANGFGDLPSNDTAFRALPLTSYDVHRMAQEHRAVVLGEMLAAGMQALAAFVRRAYVRNRERREARAAYDALRRLDDRTLRDLGFHRSETMSIAAELTGTEQPTRARLERRADRRAPTHDVSRATARVVRPAHPSGAAALRYASSTPRVTAAIVAALMTAITIGAFVVVPVSVEADGGSEAVAAVSSPADTAARVPTLAGGAATLTTLHRRTMVQ